MLMQKYIETYVDAGITTHSVTQKYTSKQEKKEFSESKETQDWAKNTDFAWKQQSELGELE